jgi:tetratricopeptide (TPR) repeat protein
LQGLPASRAIELFALAVLVSLGAGLRAAGDAMLDVEAIAERNRDAVVTLYGERDGNPDALQSSGCCVSPSGIILTVAHAVKDVDRLRAHYADGTEQVVQVLDVDESHDIAVLKSANPAPKTVALGNADALKPGSPLVAITAPKGLNNTVASGIVANLGRMYMEQRVIQTDLSLNEGSSGGPVFDRNGKLIGLVRARVDAVDRAALLTPVNDAFALLSKHGVLPAHSDAPFEALEPEPTASEARRKAVECYNRGVTAAAPNEKATQYREAVALAPDFFEGWFNLGVALASADRHEEAIEAYTRAEALRPASLEVQRNLGRELLRFERFDEVEKCFQRARKLAPRDAGVRNDLGELYRRTGRLKEAADQFKTALRLRPVYPAARYNLGLTFAAMERWSEAIASFNSYLHLVPGASDADEVRQTIADLEQKRNSARKATGGGS